MSERVATADVIEVPAAEPGLAQSELAETELARGRAAGGRGLHRRHVRCLLSRAAAGRRNPSISTAPGSCTRRCRSGRSGSARCSTTSAPGRLSFLKSPALLTVVASLGDAPSARAACAAAGVTEAELPAYRAALGTLAAPR